MVGQFPDTPKLRLSIPGTTRSSLENLIRLRATFFLTLISKSFEALSALRLAPVPG